jgi:transcriptional activator of cad operon
MAVQYWVGDFFVDLSRNQVTQKEQSQTIAPKALAVLTYLAENQGRVVSYDELFSAVWPNTVVTPNTLQRSIAQLRKALGQDSKLQSYIKTHAKQGYSLECDVRWHDKSDSTNAISLPEDSVNDPLVSEVNTATSIKPKPSIPSLTVISIITGIIIVLIIIGYQYLAPKQAYQLSFDKLRSLTATDDKEYAARYSPDGQHIIFSRYIDKLCMNNLWAKNIHTLQETRLTKNVGSYSGHNFSIDGKKLAFIATQDCDKPITQKSCYNLMSLDFTKALESPQLSRLMVECKSSQLRDPIWLDNDNIAVLQKFSNRWKLTSYSISENKSKILFELKEGNLIAFDYSVTEDLIAVSSVHDDGRHYIEMLKPDGQMLSSHPIDFPEEFSKFRSVYPNFDPLNNQLVFSSGRQFFTLSYEGKVSRISLPLDYKIEGPKFHPDGKRLVLIKKWYDSDIASIPLYQSAQKKQTHSNSNAIYPMLERCVFRPW